MGTGQIIDPTTDGGKLRAAREAAGKTLSDIVGGYNIGYLSRVERNFLPVSTGVLASYEQTVGHPIDVTPQATVAPRPRRALGKLLDSTAFVTRATQWRRELLQRGTAPAPESARIAFLLGFIDGAGAFMGPGVSQAERDALQAIAAALCRLDGEGGQGATEGGVGVLVFQEHLVVQTARTLIGNHIADLEEALGSLRESALAYEIIKLAHAPRSIIFSIDPGATGSVIFRGMHEREQLWRNEARPRTIPYSAKKAELARSLLRLAAAFVWPPALTDHEALAQVLPCGPYQTFRGPVVVRWNNACVHERCPFCHQDFKPAWGLWAFLHGLGGSPLCPDCWRKGPLINDLAAVAAAIPAEPGHLHALPLSGLQEYAGYCTLCGAYWTIAEGWWRMDAAEVWHTELPAVEED